MNNEDHRDKMEQWYVDMSNQTLTEDTWRVPYAGNGKYFPEYYVLPVDAAAQRDPADAYAMAEFLIRNGVQVSRLTRDTAVDGVTYKAGSLVVDMYQAKRNYANCVLNQGYDASASGFPSLYSESVSSFPNMRGFDCAPIDTVGAFEGLWRRSRRFSPPARAPVPALSPCWPTTAPKPSVPSMRCWPRARRWAW